MTLTLDSVVAGRAGFAVGPVDLVAPDGSFVALIGPNGGGKTTLLKTIAGLLPALSGNLRFDGGTPAFLPPPGALFVSLPTGHVVAMGRAARRGWSPVFSTSDLHAARHALEQLGIGDLASRAFDRLSSGQQQLALIARLLVQDARLCLLDEPTALLDPSHAADVERAIRTLTDAGRTVIASSHHLGLAARADQVVAIGASVRVGPPSELLQSAALSALYGTPVTLCACCHQPISETTSA